MARGVRAVLGLADGPPPVSLPPTRIRLRWQPDRRAVAAVAVAVVIAAALTAWWVLSSRPRALAVRAVGASAAVASAEPSAASTASTGSTGRSVPTQPTSAASPTGVVVDVAGKVARPGVYELTPGARVVDAVRAAGGVRKGVSTTSLNLAAPLRDGQQVLVGVTGAPAAGVAGGAAMDPGSGGASESAGPLDLNSATLAQLQTLPGVGPVLAQRILDWRAAHGRFGSVSQLDEVSGIGAVKFAQLRDHVTV